MSKSLLFKILIVFWALALIVVGVIYYKNNKGCSNCQTQYSFLSTLSEEQKAKVRSRQAVILIPDSGDPVYVDEDNAYNNAQVTAFSYDTPVTLAEEEIENAKLSLLYRKYLEQTPVELRPLLIEKKLGVILSKRNSYFTVVLSDSLEDF